MFSIINDWYVHYFSMDQFWNQTESDLKLNDFIFPPI